MLVWIGVKWCLFSVGRVDPARALAAINASSGRSLMTEERIPDEVLSRRFQYGFKLGLMLKDVDIANSIMDKFFPEAELMRVSRHLVREAVQMFSRDADYTAVTKLIEQKAQTQIIDSRSSEDDKS
jgi:3-hydroxyisobutyrate dehydrogenase